ncbi:uncharacterized protein EI97DRAFT_457418 [Westerdykella ornata]|uniref:Uncharacterized protein n=1 Tax=Westerdykella ornata TaxID=318751 RepID=A0A6A6JMP6_WESOR|nr:uncharacterized protein EI97DRAFT_457418 [Westerdykella ornata]KAF2277393.1 hypothetical protein EI97DRAFT_457418 [Westerdykella ornata]
MCVDDDESNFLDMWVKPELLDALRDVEEAKGADFGIHAAPKFVDPQIRVHGRDISIPLSQEDGDYCMRRGRFDPSIVRDDLRTAQRTYTLWPGEDFAIQSVQWESYMEQVKRKVAKDMKLDKNNPGFYLALDGMVLSEGGGIYKMEDKRSTHPDCLGTLLVHLPSTYSGGSIQLCKEGRQLNFLDTWKRTNQFLWWSSNVEVLHFPIKSGMRWALSYRLMRDNSNGILPVLVPDTSNIQRILDEYNHEREDLEDVEVTPGVIILRLSHEYAQANLRLPSLKGGDLKKVVALHHACAKRKCYLFLAFMELKRVGRTMNTEDVPFLTHPLNHIEKEEIHLTDICDVEGNPLRQRRWVDKTELVEWDKTKVLKYVLFDGLDPDQEDWMGSPEQGATTQFDGIGSVIGEVDTRKITHWYRRPVSVIVAEAELMEFLGLDGNLDVSNPPLRACRHVVRTIMRGTAPEIYRKGLEKFCKRVITHNKSCIATTAPKENTIFDSSLLQDLVLAAGVLENKELCVSVLDAFPVWDDASLTLVGNMIAQYSTGPFLDTLEKHFAREHDLGALTRRFTILLTQDITACLEGDELIEVGRRPGLVYWMTDVLGRRLQQLIKSRTALEYGHVDAVDLFYRFVDKEDTADLWRKRILKLLNQNVSKTLLVACIIDRLYSTLRYSHGNHIEVASDWFKGLIISMAEGVNPLNGFRDLAQRIADERYFRPGKQYGDFLILCRQMGLSTPYQKFLFALEGLAMSADPVDLKAFYVPCMFSLTDGDINPRAFEKDEYRDVFCSVLRSFVRICVGNKPHDDPDFWQRDTLPCNCKLCVRLSKFLRHRERQTRKFLGVSPASLNHFVLVAAGVEGISYNIHRRNRECTLEITKKELPGQSLLASWQSRKQSARSELYRNFDNDTLEDLLGDSYEDIVKMRMLETPPEEGIKTRSTPALSASSEPSGSVARSLFGSTARKRKASEVGLDDLE